MDEYKYELVARLAESGDENSMREVVNYLCERPDSNLTSEQIELAAKCFTALAKSGDAKDMLLLGTRYYVGKTGYPRDYKKAREWYEKAAEEGDSVLLVL
jgi:TPR repeat protein